MSGSSLLRHGVGLLVLACSSLAHGLDISLPTENRDLFRDDAGSFYKGVQTDAPGTSTGGRFGFSRSPLQWRDRTLYTEFHEGVDIAPVHSNRGGPPADLVHAIADGTVVLCDDEGLSNYGKQVVLRHDWPEGPVYSRYAHLRAISTEKGAHVQRGSQIGVLGWSGGGLPMEQAHLHLEIFLKLHDQPSLDEATGGIGHPLHPANCAHIDVAALLVAAEANPELEFSEHVKSLPIAFSIDLASLVRPDILQRHPWLTPTRLAETHGWKVDFTAWGFPIRFTPLASPPESPRVSMVKPREGRLSWHTRGLLGGESRAPTLGWRGKILLQLLFGNPL